MSNQLDDLFNNLRSIEAPPELGQQILRRIDARVRREKFVLLSGYTLLAVVATFAMVFTGTLVASISSSPLLELVSLLLSDPGEVATDLSSWLIAILESIPVEDLVFVLAATFLALLLAGRLAGISARYKTNRILKNI